MKWDSPLPNATAARLRLTPAGRLLAQHGRAIIERLSLAELEIESLRRGAAGTYVITAFPSAARTFVSDVWRQLLHEGSGLELRVSTDEPEQALDALATGQADIAVVHSYSNVPRNFAADITVAHLADDPVWLACRIDDPLAATGTPVALEELADRDWITAPVDLTCRTMVSRACGLARASNLEPSPTRSTSQPNSNSSPPARDSLLSPT